MSKLSPAVRKETVRIAYLSAAGALLECLVFLILHLLIPDKVPFNYKVLLGALGGAATAVLNFFLMGLTVQKVAEMADEELARKYMKASYSRRMLLQMLWVLLAVTAPVFQPVAGVLPLLFPGLGIKLLTLFGKIG